MDTNKPAGLVSARAVEDICQIFTLSMMTNVRCVSVLCIDVKGLLQHVVHENNSKIVAILRSKCYETVVLCEKGAIFHPPASSSQSVGQLLTQLRQKIVFILVVGTGSLHKRHIPSMAPVWMSSSPDVKHLTIPRTEKLRNKQAVGNHQAKFPRVDVLKKELTHPNHLRVPTCLCVCLALSSYAL